MSRRFKLVLLSGCVCLLLAVAGLAGIAVIQERTSARTVPLPGGVIVLDDCDEDYKDKARYQDNLTFINASGQVRTRISGLNICQEIGCPNRIVVDRDRGRVWLSETVGTRLLQYDLDGNELLSLHGIHASGLAVDPETGNVWVSGGVGRIGEGWIDVYTPEGGVVARHEVPGYDIAYDKVGDAFWVVGTDLVKLAKDGTVLAREKIVEWSAVSVAVNQETGMVWVAARRHGEGLGANELLGLDNNGVLLHRIPFEKGVPIRVVVNPLDGSVWVVLSHHSILRFSAAGHLEERHRIPALAADVERLTGNLWVMTNKHTLKIRPNGRVLSRTRHKARTSQGWMASY